MDRNKRTIEKLLASPVSILVIGIFIVVVNLFWFIPAESSLRSGISNVEKSTVEVAIAQIDGFLESRKAEIEIPASYINQDLGSKGNDLILKKLMRGEYITAVFLSDKNGNEIIKYDKYKTIIDNAMESIIDRKDFKRAIDTKEISWSEVLLSNKTVPSITINVPVISPIGDIIGVVSAEFRINSIFSAISNIGSGGEAQVYIVDKNGILVSGRDLSLVLKNTDYSGRKIVRDTLVAENEIVAADSDEYSYDNEKGIKVLATGGHVSKTGWAVIFEEPKNNTVANITKLSIFALSSVALFILMIVFLRVIYLKAVFTWEELRKSLIEQRELFEESVRLKRVSEMANIRLEEKDKSLVEKIDELEKFQKFSVGRELRIIELKEELASLKSKLSQS